LNCHTPSWALKSAPRRTVVLSGRNVLRTLRVVFGSTLHWILGRLLPAIHCLSDESIDLLLVLFDEEDDDDDDDDDGRLL